MVGADPTDIPLRGPPAERTSGANPSRGAMGNDRIARGWIPVGNRHDPRGTVQRQDTDDLAPERPVAAHAPNTAAITSTPAAISAPSAVQCP